jgi:hypothetical protein
VDVSVAITAGIKMTTMRVGDVISPLASPVVRFLSAVPSFHERIEDYSGIPQTAPELRE